MMKKGIPFANSHRAMLLHLKRQQPLRMLIGTHLQADESEPNNITPIAKACRGPAEAAAARVVAPRKWG